jgi:hypothetical protein
MFGWGPQLQLQLQMGFGDPDTEGDLFDGSGWAAAEAGTGLHGTVEEGDEVSVSVSVGVSGECECEW